MNDPLLEVCHVCITAPPARSLFKAAQPTRMIVKDVSFSMARGQTLGLVGESGCGKSTLARALAGLLPVSSGEIFLHGQKRQSLCSMTTDQIRKVQLVFQDPGTSLNPRMTVDQILYEPLRNFQALGHAQARPLITELLQKVGLKAEHMDLHPHEFSGGQRQRIGIARALAAQPDLLICDEPVSALDVSIQAQILNLLCDLRDQLGLSMLFISHDFRVVRHMAGQVMVMHQGSMVEAGAMDSIITKPQHPYTQSLLAAIPAFHSG